MSALLDSFDDISKGAPEPIYQQIKKTIQQRIASGEWPAGQKLPSENELVGALEVSRMTINRALRELTQEGLVKRVHGIGSFVAERPRHASLIELQDIALEIARDGKQHRSWILHQGTIAADAQIAAQLELPVDSAAFHLSAVHYQDELPIQLESRYVNPATMPYFMKQDFNQITATAICWNSSSPTKWSIESAP